MDTAPDTTDGVIDPTPYIRTFAKDYARLSGKEPAPTPVDSEVHKNLFSKKRFDDSLITNSKDESQVPLELSELEHKAEQVDIDQDPQTVETISANEASDEIPDPISLPDIEPGDIVQQAPAPKPVKPRPIPSAQPFQTRSMAPTAPVQVAPIQESVRVPEPPKPVFVPPVSPAPEVLPVTPPADAEREAILARLKARVASHVAEPVEKIESVPVTPAITPKAEPLPIIEIPKPVIDETPAPLPISTAHTVQPPEALHTYKTDFTDHATETNASAFTVLAAEKDSKPKARTAPRRQKSGSSQLVIIAASILLVFLGGGAVFAAYAYMAKTTPVALISKPVTPIIPDSSVALTGTGQQLLQALAKQASVSIASNSVVNTYVTEATTTSEGTIEEPATGGAFITELDLPAPDILLRNIDPSSMVGIVNAGGETRPFFILKVTSYERTFSGMLTWEQTMYNDLALLYPKYSAQVTTPTTAMPVVATTTQATSTTIFIPPTPTSAIQIQPAGAFVDEIVNNHSARAIKDNIGRTLLVYGYADKQTLIIARNEAAFTLLLARLQANAANQ